MKLLIIIFKESMIGQDYKRGLKYKIEFQVNFLFLLQKKSQFPFKKNLKSININ